MRGRVMMWFIWSGLVAVLAIWLDRSFFRTPSAVSSPRFAPPISSGESPSVSAPPASFQWRQIESSNYSQFIANLRKIGCPEQTIRDLVIADLSQLYSAEWKRGLIATKTNYWEAHFGCDPVLTDSNQVAAIGLKTNLQGVVRILLGADLRKELRKYSDLSSITVDTETLLSSFLPPEKIQPACDIHNKYEALIQAQSNLPFATPDSVLQARQILERQQQELAALLSPAELEQWNYRFSPVAEEIRGKIDGFDLSEEEFKALYAAQKTRSDSLSREIAGANNSKPLTPDELLGLMAAHEFNEDVLKNVLGDARLAEYERSRDVQYQQLLQFARKYEVDASLVNPVYEQWSRTESQVSQIRDNDSLSSEQKEKMIREVRESGDRILSGLLGDKHFQSYKAELPNGL